MVRGNQDFHNGDGSVGFILTGVNRSLDATSAPYLHRSAYTGGVDARWRFNGRYEVSGSLDLSRVAGDAGGDRPDPAGPGAPLPAPGRPARRSTRPAPRSSGTNQEIRFAKVGGKRLHFETAYQRRSPGFEINDIGFLRQADQQAVDQLGQPGRSTSPTGSSSSSGGTSTTGSTGPPRGCPPSGPSTPTCTSSSPIGGGCTWAAPSASSAPPTATAARAADPRSGRTRTSRPGSTIEGDDRRPLVPILSANYTRGDQGRSETIEVSPELDLKVSSRFTTSLSASYNHNRNDIQYFGTFTDAAGVAALHLRPSRPEDAEPDLAAGLHVHADDLAPGLRVAVHLQGDLHRRARGGARRAPARTMPATGPTAIPPSPTIPAASTSSSSGPTWCSAGSTGRARRCSWSGARDGRGRRTVEGTKSFRGRSGRPVRPAGERYLPGEGVVLAHALSGRATRIPVARRMAATYSGRVVRVIATTPPDRGAWSTRRTPVASR